MAGNVRRRNKGSKTGGQSKANGAPASSGKSSGTNGGSRTVEKTEVVEQHQNDTDNADNSKKTTTTTKTTVTKHKSHTPKSSDWRWFKSNRFIFIIGALIGTMITVYTVQRQDLVSLEMLSDLNFDTMLDDVKDLLPLNVLKEAKEAEGTRQPLSESFAVGLQMKEDGFKAQHPVVMIPGVISTGLESWGLEGTPDCPSQQYFRKRLWGSWNMIRAMLLDKSCWLKHIMLDPETGLDPPHFKLRAAQGMEAADFFVTGYWIWNKIIENLSGLGYDLNSMTVASYDWRLSYLDLERRDGYFSKLKNTIEQYKEITGEKTALVGHSMGTQVIFYFLKWVEAEGHGNGGPTWVNDHIQSFVDISGSTLGTPKAIVALLSGEMKDTVQLNAMAVYGLEKFFSRRERADMLRTFGGIASMLPKGGNALWGSLASAPDDPVNATDDGVSYGNFIRFRETKSDISAKNLTIADSIEFLFEQSPEWFRERTEQHYSYGLARTKAEVEKNNADPSKWINPLEVSLPNAPDMQIYCLYGVGKPTERSYYYQESDDKNSTQLNVTITPGDPNAVILGEGDGTISLLTHTMCYKWKEQNSRFNPGNIPVKVVEMLHEPDNFDIRGGAKTAEHVDILGRTELNELVLQLAAGRGHEIEEKYHSPLKEWVAQLDLD